MDKIYIGADESGKRLQGVTEFRQEAVKVRKKETLLAP